MTLAHAKYVAWWVLTKVLLGFISVSLIADGLRFLVPALGTKLHQLPFLLYLKRYELLYRLDLAPCLALFMAIAVWLLWDQILSLYLFESAEGSRAKAENHARLIRILGTTILTADALLFYLAVTRAGWNRTSFSISALAATLGYMAVLVFVSYVSVTLRHSLAMEE